MRSSKSRSRSKQNRSRSVGNIVNRVFDSSGPEGKVRGTPQQIIDKYNQLARDAQLGNDRVAAENFQQHSEHYTRMLGEAMREMEAQRQSNQNDNNSGNNGSGGGNNGQNRYEQRQRDDRDERDEGERAPSDRNDRGERNDRGDRNDRNERQRDERQRDERPAQQAARPPRPAEEDVPTELPAFLTQPAATVGESTAFDVLDEPESTPDAGLVETPESGATKPKRSRKPRTPKAPPEAAE